jgi:hypothetical protein
VLAANCLYLVRRSAVFVACVPVVGGVPGLAPELPRLRLALPRLPVALLERALGFFREVWERWEGEGILILFYDGALERFRLVAPPQRLTGRFERGRFRADLRLEYEAGEKPGPEWLKLGTFHSHGCASPRHSSIDEHDELYEAGLHLTAGYVNTPLPEFAAAFVVGRTRFTVPPEDVLSRFGAARRPPRAWLDQVSLRCDRFAAAEPWTATPWPALAPTRLLSHHDGRGPVR